MVTAVIVDAVRTVSGKGKPGGQLSDIHPAELLGRTLRGLIERTGVDPRWWTMSSVAASARSASRL